MNDPGIVIMALGTVTATAYSIKVIANAVVRHREQDRRIAELSSTSVSDERIARIEAAVESIAIEVERISEGQRFTTRLLTEQQAPLKSLPGAPGKFDTPH